MKKFTGIAAIAFAAHAGVAWAQPVIIERGDLVPGGVERPGPRAAPMRAPAELERGPSQRPDGPRAERREVQSGPSRGEDAERTPAQRREQAQREQREQRDKLPDASPPGARAAQPEQSPERNQAQRSQPDERNENRADRRSPDNARPSASPETAQPQQPEQRAPAGTARPAQTESDRSNPTAQSQQPTTRNPATATNPAAATPNSGAATPNPATATENPTATQNPTTAQPSATQPERSGQATSQPNSDQQRIADSVRERVERKEVEPVRDIGVSVTVGAQLPSRVELRPLPSDIATIRPQYRNYRYTVSEEEIIIVDPGSRRIVEVIDRRPARGDGGYFAVFERQRDVRRWRRPSTVVFETGVILPESAPLYALPPEIVARNASWSNYRYVVTETDEIAVVEPRTRRIVEVIDKQTSQSASANTRQSVGSSDDNRHQLARIVLEQAKPGEVQSLEELKGAILPTQVSMRPLPAEVERREPQLRGYQYTLIGDDVLIIDPQSRRIVDVIE